MRRAVLIVVMLAGATAGLIVRLLPAATQGLAVADGARPVRGAFHIHTRRSDGTGTPAEVAAAAARAGLQFVVLSDHDTGAAEPTAPYYSSGVLVIEAVEISTDGGHLVALGLPRAPYPLGGEARDVVEDVKRLGGMAIAAHPGSAKPDLRWVEWTAPIDGIEWLNADSEVRDEGKGTLLRTLFTYPFRRAGTLAALLDRPDDVLRRWDVLTGRRPVVAVAAADAHARIALRSGEPDDASPALHLPAYEQLFRAFSISLAPLTLTGDAPADGAAAIDAIRRGRVYSSIDALAAPAAMTFSAGAGSLTFNSGDTIPAETGNVELRVTSNAPEGAQIVLLRNGAPHVTRPGPSLREIVPGEPAVYRVEINLPEAPGSPPVPWVLSNPIYVAPGGEAPPAPARPPATEFAPQYQNGPAPDWTIETSPRSRAALDVVPAEGGTQLAMRWGLGGTASESPYAAMVMPSGPALSGYDRVTFTARADRPMRLSVQLRVPNSGDGERWHRSIYLDPTPRNVTIFFDDMTPRGPTTQRRPVLSNVRDVLFVVDTVNTRPGTSGQLWIDEVRYGR